MDMVLVGSQQISEAIESYIRDIEKNNGVYLSSMRGRKALIS